MPKYNMVVELIARKDGKLYKVGNDEPVEFDDEETARFHVEEAAKVLIDMDDMSQRFSVAATRVWRDDKPQDKSGEGWVEF